MVATFVNPTTDRLLGIYVNDHRAGAAAGLALAERMRRENEGTPLGDTLMELVSEIEEDGATLRDVANALGVRPDPVKVGAARAGEMISRLKLNGQIRGYSPLSRVLEIETLMAGIDAKRLLWHSLRAAQRPELERFDFAALAERALAQRERLEMHHRLATRVAFAGDAGDAEGSTDGSGTSATAGSSGTPGTAGSSGTPGTGD
jgi:hypothetical protein